MSKPKHIVIFSHGFGVKKDDRGLFTDIAAALTGVEAIMFDYNIVDEQNNSITVRPFSQQAAILKEFADTCKNESPDATFDLVCHSQGARIAAIANLPYIRKTIFIAPPTDKGIERVLARYKNVPGASISMDGMSKLPRTDGSTTFVTPEYWKERINEESPITLYNELAETTELIILKANQDTVLGETSFAGLSTSAKIIALDGNHDFTGDSRGILCGVIKDILN